MTAITSCSNELNLSSGKYVIVVPDNATAIEQKAAEEFQRLMTLSIPTAKIEITTDKSAPLTHEILIGATNRSLPTATTDLQRDGFTVQTDHSKLYICGGSRKGTLYGVYSFFETYLGYRLYAPDVLKHPPLRRISVAKGLNDTQIPVNTYRCDFYKVALDNEFYSDWHKSSESPFVETSEWGMFVHTFNILMPPETYFKEHPEYYALVNGKRQTSQLCLTNPAVLQIIIDELKKRMNERPDALYWSVSQNDTDGNCTCDACKALDEANGTPAGSIITFVNKVAEHFPDKIISTLAYWYSVKPPTQVKPLDNVNIMLAPIGALRHKNMEEFPDQKSFIEGWHSLSNNILLWDYVTNFAHYMAPFPEFYTLQPNIKFFIKNGVVAHFPEGNYTSLNGEFEKLRSYLLAKLMWNPDADVDAEINDFMTGYYEEAAPFIMQYVKMQHDELVKSGVPLAIYQHPYDQYEKGFLRAELLEQYGKFFDDAEASVKDKPDVLLRVQTARLPLTYAIFEIAKRLGAADSRIFETANGAVRAKPAAKAMLQQFLDVCKKANVTALSEGGNPPDNYYNNTLSFLENIKP